jgi:hypothetical protein
MMERFREEERMGELKREKEEHTYKSKKSRGRMNETIQIKMGNAVHN